MKITTEPTRRDQTLAFWIVALLGLWPLFTWLYALFLSLPASLLATLFPQKCQAVLAAVPWIAMVLSGATMWAFWLRIPRLPAPDRTKGAV